MHRRTESNDSDRWAEHNEEDETIFLAEDERAMRELLARAMTRAGYRVVEARSGVDLLDRIETALGERNHLGVGQVIVSDVRMRRLGGLEVLETLRRAGVHAPCILVTAFGDAETHARAGALGAEEVIDKPFEIEALLARVRAVLDRQKALPAARYGGVRAEE